MFGILELCHNYFGAVFGCLLVCTLDYRYYDVGQFLLQLMSAIKTGEVANVRMGSIVQAQREPPPKISVDRSGGGL